MKLYKYEIRVIAGTPKVKIYATLTEYELIAETKDQYIYLNAKTGFYDLVYRTSRGMHNINDKGAYYNPASKAFDIKPSFRAWLFTTKPTASTAHKVKELLKKCINENLGFLNENVSTDIDITMFTKEV